MTSKYVLFLFLFLIKSLPLFSQNLDGKVFIIQNNGVDAKGRVIEAAINSLGKNGAKVQLWDKTGTANQTWKFKAAGDIPNSYFIINQSPVAGKHNHLEASWIALGQDGGKVHLWELESLSNLKYGPNQVWRVTKNQDGSYSIFSAHPKSNGKVLEADSFTQHSNGGKVHLFFHVNSPNQAWNLLESG